MPADVEARIRVRYAETDQMGVVYHANYLVWFEVARVEMMRSLGLEYRRLEEEFGCMIAVVGVDVRYRHPARYDDEVAIRPWVLALRGPVLKLAYEAVRVSDERLLCTATTTHVVVNRQMQKTAMPDLYLQGLRTMLRTSAKP